ncbi:MAG: hypothetical protein HW416_3846, partial [Chloroflexi bacterium]|nr:hypothetical protein [Chloroflexota bacterium]
GAIVPPWLPGAAQCSASIEYVNDPRLLGRYTPESLLDEAALARVRTSDVCQVRSNDIDIRFEAYPGSGSSVAPWTARPRPCGSVSAATSRRFPSAPSCSLRNDSTSPMPGVRVSYSSAGECFASSVAWICMVRRRRATACRWSLDADRHRVGHP